MNPEQENKYIYILAYAVSVWDQYTEVCCILYVLYARYVCGLHTCVFVFVCMCCVRVCCVIVCCLCVCVLSVCVGYACLCVFVCFVCMFVCVLT